MPTTYKRGGLSPRSDAARRLGKQFSRQRARLKLTLMDVRLKTGFAVNTIRAHEAGSLPLRADDLIKLADAIGVRPETLIRERKDW